MIDSLVIDKVSNFMMSLGVMWKGMLGIFIFMGIFYLLIQGMNKLFPGENEKK